MSADRVDIHIGYGVCQCGKVYAKQQYMAKSIGCSCGALVSIERYYSTTVVHEAIDAITNKRVQMPELSSADIRTLVSETRENARLAFALRAKFDAVLRRNDDPSKGLYP